MATGPFQVFELARFKSWQGVFNLSTDAFRLVLCGDAQALDQDFVGASTDCRYADLTDELPNGAGYTTGGELLTGVTWTNGAIATFDADDTVWAALAATIKYAVLVDTTTANDNLIGFFDLDTVGTGVGVAGDLTIGWNAAGIFTLTQSN